jgi:glycosyltransferase involved in cell wall biosynthesis
MNERKVSIVLCCYNHAEFLAESLQSIKNQTYRNIELIVTDDSSSDQSRFIIQKWLSDNNFKAKLYFTSNNIGLSNVLNNVLDLIDGFYVKIISADDFLHKDSIKKCVDDLIKRGDEFGMVFTDSWTVTEESQLIDNIFNLDYLKDVSKEKMRELLISDNRIPALTVLMKTEALKKTGFYDSNFLIEDYYRWLKINKNYWISYLPEKLAYYRIHKNNTSTLKNNRIKNDMLLLKMKFDVDKLNKSYIESEISSRLYYNNLSWRIISGYIRYPYKKWSLLIKILINSFKIKL